MKKKSFFLSFIFLGNILEHHDKALFSLLVPFIGQQFFKSSDQTSVLLHTYSALFLGLLASPAGALLFGMLADRIGRLKVLSATILGMSFATFGIGCLPAYEKIGLLSPVLLVFFRGMQNFCAAGEKNAASVFAIEQAKGEWKAFIGSLYEASTIAGILLASIELSLLSYFNQIHRWPLLFWIAGIFGIIGFYVRNLSCETLEDGNKETFRFKDLKANFKALFLITIGAAFSYSTYVMSITFINSFLTLTTGLSMNELTQLNLWLLALDGIMLPIFGLLAVKWNIEKMMLLSTCAMSILGIPLFIHLANANFAAILMIRVIIMTAGVCFAACFRTWAQSLVPPQLRCTILGVGTSAANLLIEGPLVLLSLWSFQYTAWTFCPGLLLSMMSLLTVFALYKAKTITFIPRPVSV